MTHKTFFIVTLLLSLNGFAQWNYSSTLPTSGNNDFVDVDFTTENFGVYCTDHYYSPSSGYSANVSLTTNGGFNWSQSISESGMGVNSYAVNAVRNKNTFYYISNYQGFCKIRKSINNGNSWSDITSGIGYNKGFSAIDTTHFYFINQWGKSYIHKYAHGNITQKIDSFPSTIFPTSVFFPDSVVGYIVASNQAYQKNHSILKSTNSGVGWSNVFYDSLFNINKIYFTNALNGYAVGDSGKIVKTSDGGQNWSYLQSNTLKNLTSTYFIDENIGYAVGDSGVIINTIDGGITWNQQITGTNLGFKKVFFVNDSVGFALANNNLYKINSTTLLQEYNPTIYINNYPNPTNGIFNIQTRNTESTIEIINTFGEIILKKEKGSLEININLSNYEPGLYFIRETKNEEIVGVGKVIYLNK